MKVYILLSDAVFFYLNPIRVKDRHKFFPSNKDEQYYCMQIAVKLIIVFKQKLYNLSMEKSSLKMEPIQVME